MIAEELVTLLGVELSPGAKEKLQAFDKGLDAVVSRVKQASVVLTAAAGGMALYFSNAVNGATDLQRLSDTTGVSMTKLQEWAYAANAMGVSASAGPASGSGGLGSVRQGRSACGCPVLVGPHTFNFLQATEDAIAAGAARRVASPAALGEAVAGLLQNENELALMRQSASRFAAAHQGAALRTLDLIARWTGRAGC